METPKINNWIEQNEAFGLDYSTAKATVGDYTFDIRYDCEQFIPTAKPDEKCGLWLTIRYKNKKIADRFSYSVENLKKIAENWFKKEVLEYHQKHCLIYGTMPDIYKGSYNYERIKAYKTIADNYKVSEGTVRDIFNEGAEFYKKIVEGKFAQ